MAVKTFVVGEVLTSDATNTYLANSGLVFVKSQTVGTAVASVTLLNCFNSTYDNYRVVVSNVACSTSGNIYMQLADSGGTPNASALYGQAGFYQLAASALNGNWGTTGTFWEIFPVNSVSANHGIFEIMNPNTTAYARTYMGGMSTAVHFVYNGIHQVATAFPSMKVYFPAGTMTGGTITVYGYRKE